MSLVESDARQYTNLRGTRCHLCPNLATSMDPDSKYWYRELSRVRTPVVNLPEALHIIIIVLNNQKSQHVAMFEVQ